jgi:hypothetical protein
MPKNELAGAGELRDAEKDSCDVGAKAQRVWELPSASRRSCRLSAAICPARSLNHV